MARPDSAFATYVANSGDTRLRQSGVTGSRSTLDPRLYLFVYKLYHTPPEKASRRPGIPAESASL